MQIALHSRAIAFLALALFAGTTVSTAHARLPAGRYCGQLLSSGVMSDVETSFKHKASPSGAITGTYVFSDQGQPAEGMLVEAGDDGDGNDLTRTFIWRDKYGYGRLAVTFTPDFTEFSGKWSDVGPVLAPWNGRRCDLVTS